MRVAFGDLLRRHRLAAVLTQEALAERAGLSAKAISALESGRRGRPYRETVERLAGALDLSSEARTELEESALERRRPRPGPREQAAAATARRTLPRDLTTFTGRERELQRLVTAGREGVQSGGPVGITAIDGMAGVGKTALAVHAAHRLAAEYPDGHLYLDLHAHTAGQQPVTPNDALEALLLAAGVVPQLIPSDLDARAALWRDRVAGKRMLLLLDDVAGHEQVRPLLPGTAGCLALITSRRRLVALEDVHHVTLDTLPPVRAAELFTRVAGTAAEDAEPETVAELVAQCGHLPLAIVLIAGRLRSHPTWTARHLAGSLAHERDRLAEMRAENVAVESAFQLSYGDLSAERRRLFRLIGLHPGQEVDAFAAAALDDIDLADARRGLEALYDDHLVVEPLPGRYRMHDLVRAYARAMSAQDDAADRGAAIERLLDYYVHAAGAAVAHLARGGRPALQPTGAVPAWVPDLSARDEALAWLEAERVNLGACVDHAAAAGLHSRVLRLASSMRPFLEVAGHWDQALVISRTAVAAATAAGDPGNLAAALTDLGVLQRLVADYPAAAAALSEALTLTAATGDRRGRARALGELGGVQRLVSECHAAQATLAEALSLLRDLDDRLGEADALNEIGQLQIDVDECGVAISTLGGALARFRELGDRIGQARTLKCLGGAQWVAGDYAAATDSLAGALALFRELDDRLGQANVRNWLGIVRCTTGAYASAIASAREALALYDELGSRLGRANALTFLAVTLLRSGDPEAAAGPLAEALAISRHLGYRTGQANALLFLGETWLLSGRREDAAAALAEALALNQDMGDRGAEADVRNCLGQLLLDAGDPHEALGQYRLALRLARAVRQPLTEARSIEGVGRCLLFGRDRTAGASCLRQALAIYERLGVPDGGRVRRVLEEASPGPAGDEER